MIDQIDLIITTKNRLNELLFTLDKAVSIGIAYEQVYIIDDASEDGTFGRVKQDYPEIHIWRNKETKGLIHNRNFLMANTSREYVLSLDDDSHIRDKNDLIEALDLLNTNESFGIFSFRAFEQVNDPPFKDELASTVREVRTYIGCGHIIKRKVIEDLDQYVEEFEFYCEELDYSIRAFKLGYKVVTQDNLVVHHRIDWDKRAKQFNSDISKGIYGAVWRSKLGFSNNLLIVKMHYPKGYDLLFLSYYTLLRFWNFLIKKGDVKGFWGGLQRYWEVKRTLVSTNGKMDRKSFSQWLSLPTN